jgi:ribosomal protein S19
VSRSVWKGPFVDSYLLKKAEASRGSGRNEIIKTWSRRSTIMPQFVGLTFGVYNGKKFLPVLVTENMVGHKFGEQALAELTFSKRRIANDVKKALQSAIANAENNHQLDVDRLYVAEATAGKSFVMKRFRARARGRAGRIEKPWSRLTVVVREREETA